MHLMLHHVPDENVHGGQNHHERLVRLVKCLSPKVLTLVEQESNTNELPFLPRFVETMNYYLASKKLLLRKGSALTFVDDVNSSELLLIAQNWSSKLT
ncbi:hypothetical protein TSUD_413890 [Trifolium subterraneum]|uniref:Uncharacterized protein n=1 Tax=Trifolium subterraneum TaxID=3900 RepID=A0A2Z6PKW6_TRISU|nr:hypothetical protein TSUD_413890 [Trifolium subterraneum]